MELLRDWKKSIQRRVGKSMFKKPKKYLRFMRLTTRRKHNVWLNWH